MLTLIRNRLVLMLTAFAMTLAAYGLLADDNRDRPGASSPNLSGVYLIRSNDAAGKYMDRKVIDPVACEIAGRSFLKASLADDAGVLAGNAIYIPVDSIISMLEMRAK